MTERRIARTLASALVLAAIVLCGCKAATSKTTVSGPPDTFLKLVSQPSFTDEQKREVLELFTLRGLNSLLAAHGATSFTELDQKRNFAPLYVRVA